MHPPSPGYRPGLHWVECMRCGFDYRADQIRKEWTGVLVCQQCWEPRHPQDFVRGMTDRITPDGPINPPPTEINADESARQAFPNNADYNIPVGTF